MKNCSLCVILDRDILRGRNIIKYAREALRGGADMIQYRNKTSCDRYFTEEASALRKITKKYGRIFIVNDRVDAAVAVDADGVHIGQKDMPMRHARAIMKDKIVGVSARSLKEALAAEKDGADYIGFGPVFKTANKKGARAAGLAGLAKTAARVRVPIFAIGGIDIKNISAVKTAGTGNIAVISAAMRSGNACDAVAGLKRELERKAR